MTARVLPSETGGLGTGLPDRQIARIDVTGAGGPGRHPDLPRLRRADLLDPGAAGLTPLPPPDLTNPAGGAYVAQHLAYVVQWFLFSAFALAGPVLLLLLDRRARRRETPDRSPSRAGRRRRPSRTGRAQAGRSAIAGATRTGRASRPAG